MRLNYRTNPSTLSVDDENNTEYFSLLKPTAILEEDGERVHVYDIKSLVTLTYNLMEILSISYQTRDDDPANPVPPYEQLTAEQQHLYYPFAFMLACLQGNAFRPGQIEAFLENKPSDSGETITQYVPDAIRIIAANSGTLAEIREMIRMANQVPAANPD